MKISYVQRELYGNLSDTPLMYTVRLPRKRGKKTNANPVVVTEDIAGGNYGERD
jgi:hypothetical protein